MERDDPYSTGAIHGQLKETMERMIVAIIRDSRLTPAKIGKRVEQIVTEFRRIIDENTGRPVDSITAKEAFENLHRIQEGREPLPPSTFAERVKGTQRHTTDEEVKAFADGFKRRW
jgi:hypothetical protein